VSDMDEKHPLGKAHEDLDRMLDEGLAKYAAAEPRGGLEERILASLRAEQMKPASGRWWQWGLAAGMVLILVIALGWKWSRPDSPTMVTRAPEAVEHPPEAVAKRGEASPTFQRPRRVVHGSREENLAALPKLDQFPSPQPLTAEEIALTQYVKNFPTEAQFVAQAQQDFEFETEKEMNDAGSENWPSNSIQQER